MYNLRPPADPFGDVWPPSLSDTSRALYEKAIQAPASLTEAERRQVLQRPTQEVEDALCQQQTGITYAEIVEKALNAPDDMTYQQARILARGVESRSLQSFDRIQATRALPPDQRDFVESARAAATTERERLAYEAATPVFRKHADAISAASHTVSMDDRRNLTKAGRVPWLEHVLSPSAPPAWGFAMIRADFADDSRWTEYQDAVNYAVRTALLAKASSGQTKAAQARFKMAYVDGPDEAQKEGRPSTQILREKFAELRSGPHWIPGLRKDVYLYADTAALGSLDTERPFCWALDAEQPAEDPAEPDAQALKLAIIHIAPTFYARVLQRDLDPPKDGSRGRWAPYNGPGTLLNLRSQTGRAEDGIWPPVHQWT